MENIFFIALVAVVALLRWLSKVAEEKRNSEVAKRDSQPSPPRPIATAVHTAPGSEEERVRKFLEALGVPASHAPPRKIEPRQFTPRSASSRREILPVDPFPITRAQRAERASVPVVTAPPPLPRVSAAAAGASPLPTRETSILGAPVERPLEPTTLEAFEVQNWSGSEKQQSNADVVTLAARLATTQSLRDAIVLREIFGPPRALQPLERIIAN